VVLPNWTNIAKKHRRILKHVLLAKTCRVFLNLHCMLRQENSCMSQSKRLSKNDKGTGHTLFTCAFLRQTLRSTVIQLRICMECRRRSSLFAEEEHDGPQGLSFDVRFRSQVLFLLLQQRLCENCSILRSSAYTLLSKVDNSRQCLATFACAFSAVLHSGSGQVAP
jgi:hypothetical protein